jgi:hypothetical protein
MEDLKALQCAEVHIFVSKGGEFSWRGNIRIGHTNLNPFVKVGDSSVAVDARDKGVLDVELHISSNLSDLCGILQTWCREDKNLGMATKDKLASAGFNEVCPNGFQPCVLGWVVFKVEDSAPILHEFLIFIQGIF